MIANYTAEELLLLASAFDCEMLFGLPDCQLLVMKNRQGFEQTKNSLIEKKLLSSDAAITHDGAFVLRLLEQYASSDRYIRLDNLMTGFGEDDHLITIKWLYDGGFQLFVHEDIAFLKRIMEGYPLLQREPLSEDTTYLKKHIHADDVKSYFENDHATTLQLECFNLDYKEKTTSTEQWIFIENNGKLQGINVENDDIYQLSQYFLVKKIYDFYRFPYREAEIR